MIPRIIVYLVHIGLWIFIALGIKKDYKVHCEIIEFGTLLTGRIIKREGTGIPGHNYKRTFTISFYASGIDKKIEHSGWYTKQGRKVGDEIKIYYYDKYPERAEMFDPNYKKIYLVKMVILTAAIIFAIFFRPYPWNY